MLALIVAGGCALHGQPSEPAGPAPPLRVVLAPAAIAIDTVRRGVLVPFEVGGDLADGAVVDYIVALVDGDRVVAEVKGRGVASHGRVIGEVKLGAASRSMRVRLIARSLRPQRDGEASAAVDVPQEKPQQASCGGFVFEQKAPRIGIRDFARTLPVTISTLVSAEGLNGTVAPVRFGVGPVGAASQRFWPVQLGIPLRNGVWRVSFTLRAPLPSGPLEVRLLRGDKILADGCAAQFTTY